MEQKRVTWSHVYGKRFTLAAVLEQSCGNEGRIKELCQETNQVNQVRDDGGLDKSRHSGSSRILGKCSR